MWISKVTSDPENAPAANHFPGSPQGFKWGDDNSTKFTIEHWMAGVELRDGSDIGCTTLSNHDRVRITKVAKPSSLNPK